MKLNSWVRLYVREVLSEAIGRDYKSVETMPMNYEHYPELNAMVDFNTSTKKWVVTIEPSCDEYHFERIYQSFNSQEDAQTFARTKSDQIRSTIMNSSNYGADNVVRPVIADLQE